MGVGFDSSLPKAPYGHLMATIEFQSLVEDLDCLEIGDGWLQLAQLDRLSQSTQVMDFVGMSIQNVRFPCLHYVR